MVDGCGCGGEAYGRGGSTWLVAGGEESGVGPMELRLCRRFCWLGNEQKHPPPPNGSFGSEPSLPQGRVCSRLRRSAGRLFVVPTCFKLIGDRVSGIGVPGWGVAGSVVRGLSVFSYRGSPLPSSLFPLPSRHCSLGTGYWALGTGRWALGVGHRVFDARLSALSFRLSVCDLSLSASGVRFLVLNAVYAGWP